MPLWFNVLVGYFLLFALGIFLGWLLAWLFPDDDGGLQVDHSSPGPFSDDQGSPKTDSPRGVTPRR